ncbi:Indoleamine 2,3-dioxygenase [Dendrothele bispora CBS 962.96]|uniref:Indoleamine 2,3-dioxygenase n=1 Tax=Dendrothele bispora (strain CBS 962.96) TaxID=1314807 RepID=A0A4V4HIT2_DENBC|nr:Indoleamine 2,3-dioxygenase [Dendrothele bispora CBS 962.96]
MDLSRRLAFNITHILPSPGRIVRRVLCILNAVLATRRHAGTIDIGRRSQRDFDIDSLTGCLPPRPIPALEGKYYIWERAFADATDCVKLGENCVEEPSSVRCGEVWRSAISSWPILDVDELKDDRRKLQRAHLVLAWLTQYYVHSLPQKTYPEPRRVPAQISVPLVAVSRELGIAPVITYADTILWNWDLIRADGPMTFDNMQMKHAFSETDDEKAFYMVQAFVELHGAQALRIMDDYSAISNFDDLTIISKVARDLTRLTAIIGEISDLIQSVRQQCDPHVFYWGVRPWLNGSDAKGPTEPGWIYEGVEDGDLELSGPSGGQSTVMHALDVFLDIDHRLRQKRSPAPSEDNKRADRGFMDRMRHYMPGKHREYLEHLENLPHPVRELAQKTPALKEPYNNAVMALKKLRDLHMRIVCLYIINMSKTERLSPTSGCPAASILAEVNRQAEGGPIRGTGGTSLVSLLKAGRDATTRARV